ncbi:MAG: DUF308 domain-containing protein [Bacteroidales bacterium]|nr:DUF308 domain-containing protein [Bacteroidales bacterium]
MRHPTHAKLPANMLLYMGLIALTFGITPMAVPEFTLKIIILSIGIIIGLSGLTTLIMRLKHKSKKKFLQILSIIGSFLIIFFGLALAVYPTTFIEIFIIVLGIAIILGGISQLALSLSFFPLSYTAKVFVAFSILMIIAGTVMALNPFNAIKGITIFFGIVMTVFGLLNVIMSFWLRTEISHFNKLEKEAHQTIIEIEAETTDTHNASNENEKTEE